jgi:hypothetical protein
VCSREKFTDFFGPDAKASGGRKTALPQRWRWPHAAHKPSWTMTLLIFLCDRLEPLELQDRAQPFIDGALQTRR